MSAELNLGEWRYEIQHGPDGEANYAWLYDGAGMVATMRFHHAWAICERMNAAPSRVLAPPPRYPTYIITQEPGQVPRRKGPFYGKKMVEGFLREAYRYNSEIICIVIDMEHEDNTWYPDHGYEWLDINGDRRKRHPRKDRPNAPTVPAPPEPEGDAGRVEDSSPIFTGCHDKDGKPLYRGDRVRYLLEGPHTKKEYWNPEYEIVWVPPAFTLNHVGGGKDGGSHDFILRTGHINGSLVLISRSFRRPTSPVHAREEVR